MKLDENFTIESDTNCWILLFRSTGPVSAKTGEPTTSEKRSYHMSLKQALKAYFDEKLKLIELVPENILQIGEAIQTVYSQIENLSDTK